MSKLKDVLESSAVFGSIDDADLEDLESRFEPRRFNTGEVLTSVGEEAEFYYLLGSGCLLVALEEGKALVMSSPGDFAGLDLISDRGNYRSEVIVLDTAEVFAVAREDMKAFLESGSAAAEQVLDAWTAHVDQIAPFAKHEDILECL